MDALNVDSASCSCQVTPMHRVALRSHGHHGILPPESGWSDQCSRQLIGCGPLVDLDGAGLDTRDEFAPEIGRVRNWIEAAQQERRDTEAVVAEDSICYLFGGTHEAGGVAERPGRLGDA